MSGGESDWGPTGDLRRSMLRPEQPGGAAAAAATTKRGAAAWKRGKGPGGAKRAAHGAGEAPAMVQRGDRLPAGGGNAGRGRMPGRSTKQEKGAQQTAATGEGAAQRQGKQQRKRGPPDAGLTEQAAVKTHKTFWSKEDRARYIQVLQEHGRDMERLCAAFPDRRGYILADCMPCASPLLCLNCSVPPDVFVSHGHCASPLACVLHLKPLLIGCLLSRLL